MRYAKIIGTGSYLPKKVLTNQDLEKMVDTSDEWIVSRSGIKERRIVSDEEGTIDLVYHAALKAIQNSKIDPQILDLILVGTTSPDMIFPSTACILQKRLGINKIPAFDLQAACSGFIYAMTVANSFIQSGMYNNILVIGADTVSRFIDYTDRGTCVLFGDGAGAVVLSASDEVGIIGCEIHADGSGVEALNVGGRLDSGKVKGNPFMVMEGQAVFKMAVRNLAKVAESLLAKTGYTKEQLNWLVPHQANIRIIESTANHLNIPMDKVIVTVDRHGNTSAGSVPLALDEGVRLGKIKPGDLVMLEGVGAGFTWGAVLLRF